MTITDVGSECHNMELYKKCSYVTTFSCLFGRYTFTRLPFGLVSAGDIFQQKNNVIFKDLPNMFGTADDILIIANDADCRDHKRTLKKVKQIFCQENLKLNKNKCNFMCTTIPFFEKVISRDGE